MTIEKLLARVLTLGLICAAAIAGAQDTDNDGILDNVDNCVIHANAAQRDTDSDGWGNRCDADLNNDGIVNPIDLGLFRTVFFTTDPDGDFNGDGIVNPIDLGILRSLFFDPPGPAGYANWVNPADGDWEVASNWFPEQVPPAEAHVTIGQAAAITVYFPRADGNISLDFSAASITSTENLVVRVGSLTVGGDVSTSAALSVTGGRLDVAGDLTVDGALTLSAGTLANATIQPNATSDPVVPSGTSHFFENITLATDLVLNNAVTLRLTNDLTLAGGDVFMMSSNSFTDLRFEGTQTLGGSGTVLFAGTATVDDRNRIYPTSGNTLTIGSGVMIETDTTGGRIGIVSLGNIVLEGTVVSDLAGRRIQVSGTATATTTFGGAVTGTGGGELRLDGAWTNLGGNTISMTDGVLELYGDWNNLGTILVTNSTVDIGNTLNDEWTNNGAINLVNSPADVGGSFNLALLSSVTTDSPVNINGDFDNTGTDFNLDNFPPGVTLDSGGTIIGGTISGTGSLSVSATNANLDGVTLATDLIINNGGRVDVLNGLTLAGGDIFLASSNSFTDLRFDGSQTLGGTGSVHFAGTATVDDRNRMYAQNNNFVVTIDSGVTIETDTVGGRIGVVNFGNFVLEGTVISDVSGRRVQITGSATANTTLGGPVTGTGGGELRIDGAWTNLGGNTISVTDGVLELYGDWNNLGTILATNSAVDIGNTLNDDWTNNGAITLVNSPADVGGSFNLSLLSAITTDSPLNIDGDFDNTGTNFNLDNFPPGVTLDSGGTIIGGTISGAGSLSVSATNANLDGVTLATDLIINNGGRVDVLNGLTLAGGDIFLASSNSFTDLRFDGTQTLGGTGSVHFAGTATVDDRNRMYAQNNNFVVTIGSGVTIETDTVGGRIGVLNFGNFVLEGTVLSDVSGRRVQITGSATANTTLGGAVTGTGGGELRIDGAWTNLGGNTISMTDGVLELYGDWNNLGTILVTNSTADIGNTLNDDWINSNVITLVNTPSVIGGSFSLAQLLSLTTDSPITIDGDLDNSSTNFNVDDFPNGISIGSGGTIIGGTVSGAGGFTATTTNAGLDGVTLATDLTIENGGRVDVTNGLTLSSADIIMASSNSFTDLRFEGTQTLGGTGNVLFGGTATVDDRNRVYLSASGQTLTIGNGVTVRTDAAGGRIGNATNSSIVLQGALISALDNTVAQLVAGPFSLEGSISVGETSSVDLLSNGQFEMTATGAIDIDIGPTDNGTMGFNDSAAFDGDLNLALVNGASPAGCDLINIFSYESFSGSFDAITGPDFGGGLTFNLLLLEDIGQLQTPGSSCTFEVSRVTGNTESASTVSGGNSADRANDNSTSLRWCALAADPAPQLTVELPADATVHTIEIDNNLGAGNQFLTGRVRLLNASDTEIYTSGVIAFTNGDLTLDVVPDTALTRKIVVEAVTWGVSGACIGEIDVFGTQP